MMNNLLEGLFGYNALQIFGVPLLPKRG